MPSRSPGSRARSSFASTVSPIRTTSVPSPGAEGAGATGLSCRRTGRPASRLRSAELRRGAVEHLPLAVVPNLARYLEEMKGPSSGSTAAAGDGGADVGDATSRAAQRSSSEPRAVACGRSSAAPATRSCRFRSPAGRLANVSVAAALLLYEARRQRSVTDPTLYLFDGFNVLRAAGLEDPARADRPARALRRREGARGVFVFDGDRRGAGARPVGGSFRRGRRLVLERLAAENRDKERVLPRLVRLCGARDLRAGGGEALVESVRRRASSTSSSRTGATACRRPARPGDPRKAGTPSQSGK